MVRPNCILQSPHRAFKVRTCRMPRAGIWGIPRYDLLLLYTIGIQPYVCSMRWASGPKCSKRHHPPYWMAWLIALAIYANFFTHHYIGDQRWYIVACALGLYARTTVAFTPLHEKRHMPLLLSFVLIGFLS